MSAEQALAGSNSRLTYAPIGGTLDDAAALPSDYRLRDRRTRIGSGEERWAFATAETMSWGIKRRAGFRVDTARDDRGAVSVGSDATLRLGLGVLSVVEHVRVVAVIDEPARMGFAYGTLPGHPLRGEELFVIERDSDGSVWLHNRSFSKPSNLFWLLTTPALRVLQAMFTARYARVLAGDN
jgi:uncharacterized protein (UPF0548 family)